MHRCLKVLGQRVKFQTSCVQTKWFSEQQIMSLS